ncbi:MAG TPA: hypothetical protein VJ792_02455 [Candidatus Nitrosotalea sp.]|nr:hypothetical protein [Candidatus Nitrosotalea sp.]
MQEFQRCHECNEVTSMICRSCNRATEAQVHAKCGTVDDRVILN